MIQVGLICSVFGFLVAYVTFMRSRDKDLRNEAIESGSIKTKLDTISAGVSSIQIDIKANEKRLSQLSERVIRIEESTKQAHKRMDKFESKRLKNDEE